MSNAYITYTIEQRVTCIVNCTISNVFLAPVLGALVLVRPMLVAPTGGSTGVVSSGARRTGAGITSATCTVNTTSGATSATSTCANSIGATRQGLTICDDYTKMVEKKTLWIKMKFSLFCREFGNAVNRAFLVLIFWVEN